MQTLIMPVSDYTLEVIAAGIAFARRKVWGAAALESRADLPSPY
jgi:hypothetical protein